MRIQSREYDESRAVLTTYLYPHLKGRMTRWLEQNLGCMALSKDEMAAVRGTAPQAGTGGVRPCTMTGYAPSGWCHLPGNMLKARDGG